MADASSWWDGAAWQAGTEQWWDGSAWVAAVEAYVWDGMLWRKVFPSSDEQNTLEETMSVLDSYGLATRDREQAYSASETISVLDRYALSKVSRTVLKSARELIQASESMTRAVRVQVTETARILDRYALTKVDRTVLKSARELIRASESLVRTARTASASETASILDRYALTKVSRLVSKSARELVAASEALSVDITYPTAVISSGTISAADETSDGGRCRYTTGAFCQSTQIHYRVNSGSWTFHQNQDTSPSTSGYITNYVTGLSEDDVLQFRITPYPMDSQSGTAGTPLNTNEYTVGVE